ncbi:MAG: hypothetical protein V7607_2554 [Solirubrobacteraceae bacterium]
MRDDVRKAVLTWHGGVPTAASSAPDLAMPAAPIPEAQEPVAQPSPRSRLRGADLRADETLPPDVATLWVTKAQAPGAQDAEATGERFQLTGGSGFGSLPAEQPLAEREQPKIALSSIGADSGPRAGQVLNRMHAWSKGAETLVEWLTELYRRIGDDLKLVIVDVTGFEIPWELFSIPADDNPDERLFIGALVSVTRCQLGTLAKDDETLATVYSEATEHSSGGVLAYLNDKLGAIEVDRDALSQLRAKRFGDVGDFQAFLERGSGDYALVYLACHWIEGTGLDNAIGSTDRDQRLVLGDLERGGLGLVRRCGSAVFLNVCNSALFSADKYVADDHLYGFPALFLSHGARGVIGTVGEVLDEEAAAIGQRLLGAAAAHELPLPQLLQRERNAYVEAKKRGDIDDVQLLSIFMYVYHGSPRCTLRLG